MFGPSADLFLSGLFSEEGAFMKRVLDNCRLHKSVRQSENGLEVNFVRHWLNSVYITGP